MELNQRNVRQKTRRERARSFIFRTPSLRSCPQNETLGPKTAGVSPTSYKYECHFQQVSCWFEAAYVKTCQTWQITHRPVNHDQNIRAVTYEVSLFFFSYVSLGAEFAVIYSLCYQSGVASCTLIN